MDTRLGEMAALGTALCWAASALSFEAAGHRIGSLVVNLVRLVFAFALLAGVNWLRRGDLVPLDASAHQWGWLLASGVVGFAFGDLCMFRAYLLLGAPLTAVINSVTPVIVAAIGWIALDERLTAIDLLAVLLICAGIAWALMSRAHAGNDARGIPAPRSLLGVLLALGGALGQGGGLVLSKYGMGKYDAMAATQIRVLAGIAAFALLFSAIRWWPHVARGVRDRGGLAFSFLGATFGPFLGVTLSLLAVQHTHTGVAASLMATTPIVMLVYVALVKRAPVGWGALCGSVLAVGGVALLFLQ